MNPPTNKLLKIPKTSIGSRIQSGNESQIHLEQFSPFHLHCFITKYCLTYATGNCSTDPGTPQRFHCSRSVHSAFIGIYGAAQHRYARQATFVIPEEIVDSTFLIKCPAIKQKDEWKKGICRAARLAHDTNEISEIGEKSINLDHEHGIPMLPVTGPEGSSCNLNDCDTQQMSLGLGQQHRLTRSLVSVGSVVCRICHTNTSKEQLISPCSFNSQSFECLVRIEVSHKYLKFLFIPSYNSIQIKLEKCELQRARGGSSFWKRGDRRNDSRSARWKMIKFAETWGKRGEKKRERKISAELPGKENGRKKYKRACETCKGSLAYVHLACLERWLNQSCRSYCELCRYHFNVIETPRYRW
ncbi:hypothetical protein WN51_03406 [Melipona quadrifasciata]|uniref:RING-CH-type domain-containing protein n=1 Tax=Melipona quadrifasciata TaxID=166423 RepID=A0A0M8ZV12_9HYME|nr:hypothetical protein WN51_03406 [Melipona quadrifasciata]